MGYFQQSRGGRRGWAVAVVVGGLIAAPAQADELEPIELTPPATVALPLADESSAKLEDPNGELVRERWPNRTIKIERRVVLSPEGNFTNEGPWSMFAEDGRLMGHGQYRFGQRQGAWERFYVAGEADALSGKWGKMFEGPFVSTATFVDDQLHGTWTIVDAQQRMMASWSYDHGRRHGSCIWYFPDGCKWREVFYDHGQLHGTFSEWASDGSPVAQENYVQGRREDMQTEWFEPGLKKTDAHYVLAAETIRCEDDWWSCVHRTTIVERQGADVRHGLWTSYYRNGQKALEGTYANDRPSGTFVWWHPNGQRAIAGEYQQGKQHGMWSWWYDNGKRYIQGSYTLGQQVGEWTWWDKNGDLLEDCVYDEQEDSSSVTPASAEDEILDVGTIVLPSRPKVRAATRGK
ncbi:MAG TPA: hypothetical protein VHZ24_01465 [Pirellulales bacterium]|jgi:antitoxin component YwqK of YwqJK toxin-antitoxin module|nr:hypothetical protein [Pirellulales bacterium]